jgi:hypothetical protein
MKIIQSFWSLPAKSNAYEDFFGRNSGGWLSEKYHAMSWAFSCLKFRQFYKTVEIITDIYGNEWLINKLGLPYTNVVVSLDSLDKRYTDLWSIAKIEAVRNQPEPFLHADGDVYIWKPFSDDFINNDVVAQNIEFDLAQNRFGRMYFDTIDLLAKEEAILPDFVKAEIDTANAGGRLNAYNMGICGGKDYKLYHRYAACVMDFIEANAHIKFAGKNMNFIEQFLFYCFLKKENKTPSLLLDDSHVAEENSYAKLSQFNLVPIIHPYIHLLGSGKKTLWPCQQMELRLKYEFPKVHQHIANLYKEKSKPVGNPQLKVSKTVHLVYYTNTIEALKRYGINIETLINDDGGVKKLGSLINRLTKKRDWALLKEVFEIEQIIYRFFVSSKSNKIASERQKFKVIELLMTATMEEFLNMQFTLNKKSAAIIEVRFDYAEQVTSAELKRMTMAGKKENSDFLLIEKGENITVNTKVLTGIDNLLILFDEDKVSARFLADYITSEKMAGNYSKKEIDVLVVGFVTRYSLYHNYLVLC